MKRRTGQLTDEEREEPNTKPLVVPPGLLTAEECDVGDDMPKR